METVRTVLALAAQMEVPVYQLDVKSAFLNGEPRRKEESEKHGVHHLRDKFISELLGEEKIHVGSPFAEYRLRQKKDFIVLDDLNSLSQLEFLVGDLDQFGRVSRIVITTTDVQVLRKVAGEIYKVERLSSYEAYNLFCLNAFKENSSISDGYFTQSKRVIGYVHGVQLALKKFWVPSFIPRVQKNGKVLWIN
nr:disease resistance protein RPP2B-like [Ziziphus jujuba var. spinosa]